MSGQLIQRPKGTQDTLVDSITNWGWLEGVVKTTLTQAGYHEWRMPVFEHTELFLRGVGETTDIVNKEMYTFEKGDRSLTLRPEGTAGSARAYLENGLTRAPKPVRAFYMGPMFRYERPQAGRLRQFHQVGVEQFGVDTPASDLEVLHLAHTVLTRLGLTQLTLHINNLGTADDRQLFKTRLQQYVQPLLPQLCPNCQARYNTNPLRMLDCKVPECQALYQGPDLAPLLTAEFASAESQAHFNLVCQGLQALGIPYVRNPQLVRGLDYYTGLVFEVVADNGQLGAQNVVCGGGRYNGLMAQLGGPDTPAVGFAFGIERLLALLPPQPQPAPHVVVVTDDLPQVLPMVQALRDDGLTVVTDVTGKAFGKQLEAAAKTGAKFALLVGQAERDSQTVQLKRLASGEQQTVDASVVGLLLANA
jgi:histidyl-tRNA synthetase